MENSRGSEWRKWDLHMHSLKTHLNNNYSGVNEDALIKKLQESGIRVVGLTNYFNFTREDYELKKKLEQQGITVFLNLELRLTYQNKEDQCCDIHIIFNDELKEIDSFLSNLTIKINGRAKKANALSSQDDFINGTVEFDHLIETLNDESLCLKNNYLIGFLSRGHGSGRTSSQYEQLAKQCHFLIHSSNSERNIVTDREFWLKQGKALLQSSDAHSLEQIGAKFTWIKADTTFDGLKQILYEPEERVQIQDSDPSFYFDKSPFTEIDINSNVKLFKVEVCKDEDNISFAQTTIPLNSGLVSIIGGRGTGKSKLIDYIACGLGKPSKLQAKYNKSADVIIKRKVSLQEAERFFPLSDDNNIPFMYISQSEIKEIVENNTEFTNKIRELIGIPAGYSISESYINETNQIIGEYADLINSLYADGMTGADKISFLDVRIKQNEDFIKNVTSDENRVKLEEYKQAVEELQKYIKIVDDALKLQTTIRKSTYDINSLIDSLNYDILSKIEGVSIPLVNLQYIDDYIVNHVFVVLQNKIAEQKKCIDDTKNKFSNYNGDLTTLLDNISMYQNEVNELKQQRFGIEKAERRLNEIAETQLKKLGEIISNDILHYKTEIENKWNVFTSGKEGYNETQTKLLKTVLGIAEEDSEEKIELFVNVFFDENEFYRRILGPYDKRSWKKDYLKEKLKIDSYDSFVEFITNPFNVNIFDGSFVETIHLLHVLYKEYTNYITHTIEIKVNNKPLHNLSVGQRGTIYLRLQLAANLFSETIIYDQPEDDLDNKFITQSLVDLFKKIKKYRQIIIVSHNANLVVNADSEQVIVAHNDDGVLSYASGSLENNAINQEICTILEGGKTAFEKREQKYGFR